MQVSGLLVAGVLLSAFCLVPSKSSASASTATWPTPSPALQTATPLFRKMKGYRCKDRNEICTQAEPPCQQAKANLDECRELCASIYECTSFEFKANKVCRLSTTCTEALMVRGPTREDLYLKQPPPDPRYPGLVSRDLGQVTEVGDYSCVSSGGQTDGWTFIKDCESHKGVRKSQGRDKWVTFEGGGTAADCFNECAELDGCNYVTWEGEPPMSRMKANYSKFRGAPSLYSWDYLDRNASSPGKLWKYCDNRGGKSYSIVLPSMPPRRHLMHSLAIVGGYKSLSITGGYTSYQEVTDGMKPGHRVWGDREAVWTSNSVKGGTPVTAIRPDNAIVTTGASPQERILLTVVATGSVSLHIMVRDPAPREFDFDLSSSDNGGFVKIGTREFRDGNTTGSLHVYSQTFNTSLSRLFKMERKAPYLLQHMPRNLGQNQNCKGRATNAYIAQCVSKGSASGCAQECGRMPNCRFITWTPDHSSYRRRSNGGLNYMASSSGGAWKGKGHGHMWRTCDSIDHTGTAVFGVVSATPHTLAADNLKCSTSALITSCKTPTTAGCLQECAEHPECKAVQWRRLFLDAQMPSLGVKRYHNVTIAPSSPHISPGVNASNAFGRQGTFFDAASDFTDVRFVRQGTNFSDSSALAPVCSDAVMNANTAGRYSAMCRAIQESYSSGTDVYMLGSAANMDSSIGCVAPVAEGSSSSILATCQMITSNPPVYELANWARTKSLPGRCWRKMPTGCNRHMGEAGSDGRNPDPQQRGTEWFVDPHANGKTRCIQREQDYNRHCTRTDAQTYFGHAPLNHKQSEVLDLGNPSKFQITGDQTISMWIRRDSLGQRVNPFNKAYGGEGTITMEGNGRFTYYYGEGGSNTGPYQGCQSLEKMKQGELVHITAVRDLQAMEIRIYFNGKFDRSCIARFPSAAASSLPLMIGKGYTGHYVDGELRNLRLYDRALSPNEIAADMKAATMSDVTKLPLMTKVTFSGTRITKRRYKDSYDQREGYGVGQLYSSCDDKNSPEPSALPGRCWRKMPTGCSRHLGEAGSDGRNPDPQQRGTEWFVDPHGNTKTRCNQREQDFNRHCSRTDAQTYFGHAPFAFNVFKVEKCRANVESSTSCFPAPQLPPARYIKITAGPGMDISHVQVACEDLNHKRLPLQEIKPKASYTEYIESGLKSYMDCRDIVCRAHNCKDFTWDQWTLKCTVYDEVLRGTKTFMVSSEFDAPKNLSRVIVYNQPDGGSSVFPTTAACKQQTIMNATLSISTTKVARDALNEAQWNEVDIFNNKVAETYTFEACKARKPTAVTESGILHPISSCYRCGINFCTNYMRVEPEESNMYTQVGPEVEAWGCDKVDQNSPRVKFGHHVYIVDDGIYSPAQIMVATPAPTPTPAPSPEKYHTGILGENACDYGDSVVFEQCHAAAFAALPHDRTATTDDIILHPDWSVIPPRGYQKIHTASISNAPPGCSIRFLPGALRNTSGVQQWDALWNINNFGVNDGNWTSVCTELWANTMEPTATPTSLKPTRERHLTALEEVADAFV